MKMYWHVNDVYFYKQYLIMKSINILLSINILMMKILWWLSIPTNKIHNNNTLCLFMFKTMWHLNKEIVFCIQQILSNIKNYLTKRITKPNIFKICGNFPTVLFPHKLTQFVIQSRIFNYWNFNLNKINLHKHINIIYNMRSKQILKAYNVEWFCIYNTIKKYDIIPLEWTWYKFEDGHNF